jgi:hypothetical protein
MAMNRCPSSDAPESKTMTMRGIGNRRKRRRLKTCDYISATVPRAARAVVAGL